jgi:flagellar export protein FliJ
MKRFVWRLQQVLDIKAKEEQVKKTELFQLTEKVARKRGELLIRQKILKDVILSIAVKEPLTRLNEQQLFLKYSAASDEQIKKLQNEIRKLESQQKDKIAEVVKIRRFKEGLERLRDEAKKRFIKEQEKIEQKELDEGATIRFACHSLPATLFNKPSNETRAMILGEQQ